jgi:hypothetical protein
MRSWASLAVVALGCQAGSGAATAEVRIARGVAWMAAFPVEQLRFDAAIGLAAIRRRVDGDAVRAAEARARSVADRDLDNPLRRAFDDADRVEARAATGWAVPGAGEARVNVNRVVGEALHCAEHGLRPTTLAYLAGPMRDGGGYHSTHAAWALAIARQRGCVDAATFSPLAAGLIEELRGAEPARPGPGALEVDLFAERLLMMAELGAPPATLTGWAQALGASQADDGGFGALAAGEEPYHRYHATMMATWALAVLSAGGS